MISSRKENLILSTIKYGPVIFIIIMSLLITTLIIEHEKSVYDSQIEKIENSFINDNKIRVKEEVTEVYHIIKDRKDKSTNELKKEIEEQVNNAYAIIKNLYEKNKMLPKQEIYNLIKEALRPIRFNDGKGYFFIYELSGKNILNAGFANLEGKNLINHKDLKGVFLLQEMKKILSVKKETFYDWFWHKDESKIQYKKTGFFKKFEPLGIFVGTGIYVSDFENSIKNELLFDLKNRKYGKNGYVFIVDDKGYTLSHIKDSVIGKNAFEDKNYKGEFFIKNIINFAETNKEGYFSYSTPTEPKYQKEGNEKTSYLKYYEDWNWILGSGFYKDELFDELLNTKESLIKLKNDTVRQVFIISIVLTFLFMIISIYLSSLVKKIFNDYKKSLNKEYHNSLEKEKILLQQSKMAAMGEMIANISHQWRQPLSAISVSATGMKLQKELGVLDDDKFFSSVDSINQTSQYLSKTIDDFRNFLNPSKKEYSVVSISKVIDNTLKLIENNFVAKEINIHKKIVDVEIYTIKNELLQALINILNNAKDALLEVDNKRVIIITTFKEDSDLFIEICDSAGGIRDGIIQRVFEPYFTTKHQKHGTGIGLYMTKEIITKHLNGSIEIENKEFIYDNSSFKGACIKIKLPIES